MNATLTLDETLAAVAQLRADAENVSRALHKHVSATPRGELHGRLHRMLTILRELAASLSASVAPTLHRAEPKP